MKDKDFIDIYDEDGNVNTMELVFEFPYKNINYIIYKDNSNILYAAKYEKSIDEDFNSDLTREELALCQKVFKEIKSGKSGNSK